MPEKLNTSTPEEQTCPTYAFQASTVCVPITVTPFARTGGTFTKCCGAPSVTPGRKTCEGTKNGSCVFTVSQDICVTVPVVFGAVAEPGDTYVSCIESTGEDVCTDCGEDD